MLKKSKPIRVFFGLPIPENRGEVFRKRILENNPKIEHRVRWVKPGNHHITVQFLGNIAEEKIPSMISATKAVVASIKPFNVVLRNIVAFPNRNGRWVAVNVQPSVELQNLHDTIALAMVSEKFSLEKRVYNPHITMFRLLDDLKMQFESISLNNEEVSMNELILYKSLPEPGGSVYIPLYTLAFDH